MTQIPTVNSAIESFTLNRGPQVRTGLISSPMEFTPNIHKADLSAYRIIYSSKNAKDNHEETAATGP